ncbi:MAG: glycosyltransferase family 2 protein [Planctomycetes bacterium]|nr:glycosyltransferase family 2 protein [Planctomycetota bacterium]
MQEFNIKDRIITAPNLSVVMAVLNEERHLDECLASCAFAGEIVVVDTKSSDRTPEICREWGVTYIDSDIDGILEKKRLALREAKTEWAINVDADERITSELAAEISALLQTNPERNGYEIRRRNFYLGRWVRFGEFGKNYVPRLIRRGKAQILGTDPHDHIVIEGKFGRMKHPMNHFVYRDLSHQIRTVDRFSTIAARFMKERGKRFSWLDLLFRPGFRFFRGYVLQLGFLDGLAGIAIAAGAMYYNFAKFIKLRELELAEIAEKEKGLYEAASNQQDESEKLPPGLKK